MQILGELPMAAVGRIFGARAWRMAAPLLTLGANNTLRGWWHRRPLGITGKSSYRWRQWGGSLGLGRMEGEIMSVMSQFCWGFLGSMSVEIVLLCKCYQGGGDLPSKYRSLGFWITRLLLASLGGGLAVAYEVQTPLLAFHLGATTPLVIQALSQHPFD